MDEPKVTAASKNTYSNRNEVAKRYDTGDLADSKFWYHVEMFDNARLRRLLSTVRAPNLVKVLDSLKKDAALLCYYFFSRPTRRGRSRAAPMSRPRSSEASPENGCAWRCCSKKTATAPLSSRPISG